MGRRVGGMKLSASIQLFLGNTLSCCHQVSRSCRPKIAAREEGRDLYVKLGPRVRTESSTGVTLGAAGEGVRVRCCTINGRGTLTWQTVCVCVCVCMSAHILLGRLGNILGRLGQILQSWSRFMTLQGEGTRLIGSLGAGGTHTPHTLWGSTGLCRYPHQHLLFPSSVVPLDSYLKV